MSTYKKALFSLFFILAACSSDAFITYSGNMPSSERIAKLKVGQDKQTVLQNLGSPSQIISLDSDTWIYMSSKTKQIAFCEPVELERDILKIQFTANGEVVKISNIGLKDGKEIVISEDKTATAKKDTGFFEKYFGGAGQYSPFGAAQGDIR